MGKITLYQGDITDLATDAIVNAANNRLWMGAGVAGAIKRKGGAEIEREAVAKGPIPIGEAVVTGAGRLKAEYVIHAAVMGQDLRTDAAKIRAATENSLKRANELGLTSIAFPALGTGVGGFPLDECARVMFSVVRQHLAGPTSDKPAPTGSPRPGMGAGLSSLQEVVFALWGEEAYRVFADELARV
jgi:O-acetyl-ADP-ribose deacetylase (regulator of RNase III)